jgi:hypothetical protein
MPIIFLPIIQSKFLDVLTEWVIHLDRSILYAFMAIVLMRHQQAWICHHHDRVYYWPVLMNWIQMRCHWHGSWQDHLLYSLNYLHIDTWYIATLIPVMSHDVLVNPLHICLLIGE